MSSKKKVGFFLTLILWDVNNKMISGIIKTEVAFCAKVEQEKKILVSGNYFKRVMDKRLLAEKCCINFASFFFLQCANTIYWVRQTLVYIYLTEEDSLSLEEE